MKQRSDVDIMRDAKLEAMGYAPQEDRKPRHDKPQMATDEMVRGSAPLRVSWDVSDVRARSWNGSRNGCDDSVHPFSFIVFFDAMRFMAWDKRHTVSALMKRYTRKSRRVHK